MYSGTRPPVQQRHSDDETGENVAKALIRVIREIGAAKVVAVITDNAAYCNLAKELVTNEFPV